jgi:SOS-response transcriptional repressor LexA
MASNATELRVKELLQEHQWTTKVLAERTGISESYLTHIKNRTRRWNEDILRRLAEAFEVHPVELFSGRNRGVEQRQVAKKEVAEGAHAITPRMVPVMKEIPAHPSPYNNQLTQVITGCKDVFVPVVGVSDPDMFCVRVDNSNLKPRFTKGDYLIVSPASEIVTGDVVAVEYGDPGRVMRTFMQVAFVESFVILEALRHKQAPVAIAKNKDTYRFIGKVVMRYQKID